jgi:hypothetical protein
VFLIELYITKRIGIRSRHLNFSLVMIAYDTNSYVNCVPIISPLLLQQTSTPSMLPGKNAFIWFILILISCFVVIDSRKGRTEEQKIRNNNKQVYLNLNCLFRPSTTWPCHVTLSLRAGRSATGDVITCLQTAVQSRMILSFIRRSPGTVELVISQKCKRLKYATVMPQVTAYFTRLYIQTTDKFSLSVAPRDSLRSTDDSWDYPPCNRFWLARINDLSHACLADAPEEPC